MWIALAGSHGTGKSTLVQDTETWLRQHRPGLTVCCITEVARRIISRGLPLNREATVLSYVNYVRDQLAEERSALGSDVVLSDRTILDAVAYAKVNKCINREDYPEMPTYVIEMMKEAWLLEKERFDFYVLVPVEFPMVSDGVRPEDEEYRSRVSGMLLGLLDEFTVDYVTVAGTRDARLDALLKRASFPDK